MQRQPIHARRRHRPHVASASSPCRRSLTASTSSTAIVRRSLCIAEFSRAANSGVWYYHVDIAVFNASSSSGESLSGDESDDSGYASPRCSLERAVQRYSVRRRYSDFLDLYGRVKEFLAADDEHDEHGALPPFPEKELISPSVFGSLWRLSSSRHVLEERRSKFEALLQFIEQHAAARRCAAFEHFLGQPPQRQDGGYVSLKEYTAQNWFASLKLLARAKREQRQRHYTMDAEHLAQLIDGSGDSAQEFLGKRRRRARPRTSTSSTLLETTDEVPPLQASQPQSDQFQSQTQQRQTPALTRRGSTVVEAMRPRLKKSKSFHHTQMETASCIAAPKC